MEFQKNCERQISGSWHYRGGITHCQDTKQSYFTCEAFNTNDENFQFTENSPKEN